MIYVGEMLVPDIETKCCFSTRYINGRFLVSLALSVSRTPSRRGEGVDEVRIEKSRIKAESNHLFSSSCITSTPLKSGSR